MIKTKKKITIIQPFIPHYREEFFIKLGRVLDLNILCVRKPKKGDSFKLSSKVKAKYLNTISFRDFYLFNPFSKDILKNKIIVMTPDYRWISIFPMLLIKKILNLKIFFWTHGVSIKNGFNPTSLRDMIKTILFNLSDGIIFYTKNELDLMGHSLNVELYYLNNTIDIEKIFESRKSLNKSKKKLKKEYNILASRVLIYCARFIKDRRADLLVKLIKRINYSDIHWIIIGEGPSKPEFKKFKNVSSFNSLYNLEKKTELFALADYSFQPAWTGLSIVESFAFGVPFITFKKSSDIFQSVEYNYLINGKNGFIIDSLDQAERIILNTTEKEINEMKNFCTEYARKNLNLDDMVSNFSRIFDQSSINFT